MKSFKAEEFIIDLNFQLQSYCNIHNQDTDVNEDVSRITETYIKTLNSRAPFRPLSRSERKLNEKPWITKGILKSIRTKNKLFKSCYKCSEANKMSFIKNIATSLRMQNPLQKVNIITSY